VLGRSRIVKLTRVEGLLSTPALSAHLASLLLSLYSPRPPCFSYNFPNICLGLNTQRPLLMPALLICSHLCCGGWGHASSSSRVLPPHSGFLGQRSQLSASLAAAAGWPSTSRLDDAAWCLTVDPGHEVSLVIGEVCSPPFAPVLRYWEGCPSSHRSHDLHACSVVWYRDRWWWTAVPNTLHARASCACWATDFCCMIIKGQLRNRSRWCANLSDHVCMAVMAIKHCT
jgi:hypothetical protein